MLAWLGRIIICRCAIVLDKGEKNVTSSMVWGVQGLLTEGFFWIPSLAGPTTIAARQNGSGVSWLFPFVVSNP
jgi:hypothetical protein